MAELRGTDLSKKSIRPPLSSSTFLTNLGKRKRLIRVMCRSSATFTKQEISYQQDGSTVALKFYLCYRA
ncbi:hypothetical protein Y032_0031g2328 [Ancylostoma ceylanicum]|uniref:Uncharacterized protein n=1 Tax=Ancylostoma ceylanicum TaxID=53326 RepID=A0A016URR2_9BILA|nr:hypothetical protein Y032_0031g2328 [Ancylostoma ceylanicum]